MVMYVTVKGAVRSRPEREKKTPNNGGKNGKHDLRDLRQADRGHSSDG